MQRGTEEEKENVEIEYVTESISPLDPNYRAFAKIFEAFKVSLCVNLLNTVYENWSEDLIQ